MSCEGIARGWEVLLSLTTFEFGVDQSGRHQCLDDHKPCHGLSVAPGSAGVGTLTWPLPPALRRGLGLQDFKKDSKN